MLKERESNGLRYLLAADSGHDDEVLDVSFDATGQHLVTGSADGKLTSYVY